MKTYSLACLIILCAANCGSVQKHDPQEQSSQKLWDDDVARVSREVERLKLRLRIKTHESNGFKALRDGDYRKARQEYDKLVAINPKQPEAQKLLACLHASRGIEYMSQAGIGSTREQVKIPYQNALVEFDKALELGYRPESFIQWEKSMLLTGLGRYAESVKLYEQALTADPKLMESPGHKLRCAYYASHGLSTSVCG